MASVPGRNGGDNSADRKAVGEGIAPEKPKRPKLSKAAGDWWDWILPLLPERVLSRIDAIELMLLCNLLEDADKLTKLKRKDPTDLKPARLYIQVVQQIHRFSLSFGLNPPDRARIGFDDTQKQTISAVETFRNSLN